MQILVDDAILKPLTKKYREIQSLDRYRNDQKIRLDLVSLTDAVVEDVRLELVKAKKNGGGAAISIALSTINLYRDTLKNPYNTVVRNLQHFVAAAKAYINTGPHLYLFRQNVYDDQWMPYVVTEITYTPHNRRDKVEAFVQIDLAYYEDGEVHETHERYRQKHVGHSSRTVAEILRDDRYVLENEVIFGEYADGVERYRKMAGRTGMQVIGTSYAKSSSGRNAGRVPLEVDGLSTRLVIDDESESNEEGDTEENELSLPTVSATFWGRSNFSDELPSAIKQDEVEIVSNENTASHRSDDEVDFGEDDEDDNEIDVPEPIVEELKTLNVPIHPYIQVFSLRQHEFCHVHAGNIEPYEYDTKIGDKLVLPEDSKELISILIENAHNNFEDIIKGKSGGSIILCAGEPGTGKTLTAEVYAEIMERPLYTVQCSQLGLSHESLEKELKHVLKRAMRWKAILLLDEADVYIHARGADIEQNAIVGIFLRVLEYYNGVLFMTTNRADDIDDAIASRSTAKLVYKKPSVAEQKQLWEILSKQAKLELDKVTIASIVNAHSDLSGRDIKNLVKLGSLVSKKRGTRVNTELITYLRKFKQV